MTTHETPRLQPPTTTGISGFSPEEGVAANVRIVGIGASAGGLEAFERFFHVCPADTALAFVLVPHLDPDHQSLLTEILQRSTTMPVVEAVDQTRVESNHVYIIPPNREIKLFNGQLQLSLPEKTRGQRMPIDGFLRSMAEDQADRAVGIILSGTATDGTLGLRAILGAGGICMVQEPDDAKYDGMPRSAIAAGYATHILSVEKMPVLLQELTKYATLRQRVPHLQPAETVTALNQILLQIRKDTGHDFSLYKKSTIGRRVQRRMAQYNIEDMAVYARFLSEHPPEVQTLFKELLINVTSFFRDSEAFEALKHEILPLLLADKPDDYVVRIWVAGCASGEEAYSIAMVLREYMEETQREFRVQIYATDLDDDVIVEARSGRYLPNIAQDVTPERLRRFFTKEDTGHKVNKTVREMVIFAVQSVIKDPPFTRLDLLSCRNLLIYLEPEQQNRLLPVFHYALKPGGVLFLSTSESITQHAELFRVLNRKWQFYQACHTAGTPSALVFDRVSLIERIDKSPAKFVITKPKTGSVADLSNRILLQAYAPASVTTDASGNILYVHGDTSHYLRTPHGPVTTNVVEMAREGLQLDLRSALIAAAQGTPTLNQEVSIPGATGVLTVSFSVRLLPAPTGSSPLGDYLLLMSFQDVPESVKPAAKRGRGLVLPLDAKRFGHLERELAYAKENLQATIEAQQATNEELKSANEELQSTNEELQSANEELETSKEELQSLNEETTTVNAELTAKIAELSSTQSDMKNLLDNVSTGIVFLDYQLNVRRFTPEATKIYRLIPSDAGRPLSDIKSSLEGEDMLATLQNVLETLIPREREVRTKDGSWFLSRVQPYRTLDNVIAGVVMTFTDVTAFKRATEVIRRNETLLKTAQEIIHLGSWELELATGQAHWSEEMFKIFGYPVVDKPMAMQDILNTLCPQDQLRVTTEMQRAVSTQTPYALTYRITRQDGTSRMVRSRAMPVLDAKQQVSHVVGTSLDITEIQDANNLLLAQAQLAREIAEAIVNTVSEPLVVLDGAMNVVSANRAFYRYVHHANEQAMGASIFDLGGGAWNIPALHQLLEDVLTRHQAFEGYVMEHHVPGFGLRRMVLNARRLVSLVGDAELILLTVTGTEPGKLP